MSVTPGPYLRSATIPQIADELTRRARLVCSDCFRFGQGVDPAPNSLPRPDCPTCHGSGWEPWPELQELAEVLRNLGLPY